MYDTDVSYDAATLILDSGNSEDVSMAYVELLGAGFPNGLAWHYAHLWHEGDPEYDPWDLEWPVCEAQALVDKRGAYAYAVPFGMAPQTYQPHPAYWHIRRN